MNNIYIQLVNSADPLGGTYVLNKNKTDSVSKLDHTFFSCNASMYLMP